MKKIIKWKYFFILLAGCLLGIVAIFPYLLAVQKDLLRSIPIPLNLFIGIQIIQSLILFLIALFVGLLLAPKVGFTFPLLEAIVSKSNVSAVLRSIAPLSLILGSLTGIAIIVFDYIFMQMGVKLGDSGTDILLWKRFLACFYGGINEEVLMRLFLMTLFVWISMKVTKTKQAAPPRIGVWISLIIAALLFAAGHLPITASLTALTPLVVMRAILLNGIGGVVFGWLYWKKGLEAAMIAHFVTDLFIQIVFPFFL